ncbi:MAG TPA: DNA methyltransferase, partial [Burkholderiales bacterium]
MLQITRRTLEERRQRRSTRKAPAEAKEAFLNGCPQVPVYEEELWTSRQRQASSIHEVSYRACFKPQLPAYFIDRLSDEGDIVYDPFSGRGTTAVEGALRARRVIANDINPLSAVFARPRLEVPHMSEVDARLDTIDLRRKVRSTLDLSMFF